MYNWITEWAELFPNIYSTKGNYSFTHNPFAHDNNSHWLTLWIRRKAITEADSSHTKDADRRTTHQWGELSLILCVLPRPGWQSHKSCHGEHTATHREQERREGRESIELDTEERIAGGWDALKVAYDNEGQFWITMVIRCKTRGCSRFHWSWEIWKKKCLELTKKEWANTIIVRS